ncbi:MAG: multidrug efflux SMR transporter [Pseudonocardiaceae bacterium]|nr:multidrug efflux SMR transporter [Pseudonocardiaceae bacterium]
MSYCQRVVLVVPELHSRQEDDIAWILLIGAIVAEITATATLKLSDGLTRLLPTVVVAVGYNLSFVLLAQALKENLQVSVAYAIWCGVGTAAITVIGMLTLNEPLTAAKVLGILMITGGVVTLSFTGTH